MMSLSSRDPQKYGVDQRGCEVSTKLHHPKNERMERMKRAEEEKKKQKAKSATERKEGKLERWER